MATYKRCPEAKDDACGKTGQAKPRGAQPADVDDAHRYVVCCGAECKKTGDIDCKCFVLAMHVKINDEGKEEIMEEDPYPASYDQDHQDDLLNKQKIKDSYPPKDNDKHAKDYWKIECRCLEISGKGKPVKV